MSTRHWIEAFLGDHGPGFRLVCEHPQDCSATVDEERADGCAVAWHWANTCDELIAGAEKPFGFGRLPVEAGFEGEDQELRLRPALDSAGILITATDLETGEVGERVIRNDVCVITAGTCFIHGISDYPKSGTQVITVKGRHGRVKS